MLGFSLKSSKNILATWSTWWYLTVTSNKQQLMDAMVTVRGCRMETKQIISDFKAPRNKK
jgi:hypothetical protein